MRTGLVALGMGLAVLGVAIVYLAALNFPYSTQTDVTAPVSISLPHDGQFTYEVNRSSQFHANPGELEVKLRSSVPIQIWVTSCAPTGHLPPTCLVAGSSDPMSSADYVMNSPSLPYFVITNNPNNATASPTIDVESYYNSNLGSPLWEVITIMAGGSVLLAGGSLAIFLGLFLKGNPYAPVSESSRADEEPRVEQEEKTGDSDPPESLSGP